MGERNTIIESSVNCRQICIGAATLFIGTLVYLIDRPPDHTYFVYSNLFDISLHNTLPNIFGIIGNSLPTLIHVFSFILITAGLLSCQRRGCLIICVSWFIIDSAFELGQGFKPLIVKIIPEWFAGIPFLENTENYFLHGTFDLNDLVCVLLGSIMAYFVLLTTNRIEKVSS